MKNNLTVGLYMRVGSIEQLDGQLEDVHIPGKMDENRKDVLIYCRVAQDDNYTINLQRDRLIDYAYDKGFYVKGIYQDIGSGLNFERKGLTALVSAAERKSVDYILVQNIDRIGRGMIPTLQLIEKFAEKNVKIFCSALDQEFQPVMDGQFLDELRKLAYSKTKTNKKHHICKYDVFCGTATVNC